MTVFFKKLFRRVGGGLAAILLASLITFLILEASPGDVTLILLGDTASQAEKAAIQHELGLDRPVLERYLIFITNLVTRGDLGTSAVHNRPVVDLISQRFANTLVLAVGATLLALILGLLAGTLAASQQGRWPDTVMVLLMSLGLSMPVYGLAILFTQIFSVDLGWLPAVGAGTARHYILPCISLAVPASAVIARLARASLLETLGMQYVQTAHSKGLTPRMVWMRHILRNSLVPVVALVGVHFGHLLSGAFIVETIFAWPGLGRLTVQAIFDQDYPVVLGSVILAVVLFQLLNLAVDFIHSLLDPKVRLAGR